MKSHLVLAGTVLLSVINASGKERLMMQQMMIVTPRTAEALGLSYENLWNALKLESGIPHGSPIVVRLITPAVEPAQTAGQAAGQTAGQSTTQTAAQTSSPAAGPAPGSAQAKAASAQAQNTAMKIMGPVATLPLEKAALAMDKNAFVRT